MSAIIKVEHLSKSYSIKHQGKSNYVALRDVITDNVKGALYKTKNLVTNRPVLKTSAKEEFWALNDVNFEVQKGDRIGIIGRNGAGKSTVLKVLSRITEPTRGRISISGRIASLLEVGTGFHPELTGRENIYLNGAILGMHRSEIISKFDEIVDFSGVEKFLDTPVKRYSSGMYVRLAFAVAAHLEPEILIVDEVLAVGDAEFQKKCLGKMQDVSQKGGRTVIFVSHNMAAIESLCQEVILLNGGKLIFKGSTKEGISNYLNSSFVTSSMVSLAERTDRTGNGKVKFVDFKILDDNNEYVDNLLSGNTYTFELRYKNFSKVPYKNVKVCLEINDDRDNRLLFLRNDFTNEIIDINKDSGVIKCKIENLPLAIGTYYFVLYLSLGDLETLDLILNVKYTDVVGGNFFGTGSQGLPDQCKILTETHWT
jgi:lipopolysaccharide transport system ATP-binding protein